MVGERGLEVDAHLARHGGGARRVHSARIGEDEEERRGVGQCRLQRGDVPARQQQAGMHRLRAGGVVVEDDDLGAHAIRSSIAMARWHIACAFMPLKSNSCCGLAVVSPRFQQNTSRCAAWLRSKTGSSGAEGPPVTPTSTSPWNMVLNAASSMKRPSGSDTLSHSTSV